MSVFSQDPSWSISDTGWAIYAQGLQKYVTWISIKWQWELWDDSPFCFDNPNTHESRGHVQVVGGGPVPPPPRFLEGPPPPPYINYLLTGTSGRPQVVRGNVDVDHPSPPPHPPSWSSMPRWGEIGEGSKLFFLGNL